MALDLVDDASAEEPLTLDEVKRQVKLATGDADDPENPLIEDILIPAVRSRGEIATRRGFRECTYDLAIDAFPCAPFIELPKPPLLEVVSVTYLDTGGTLVTMAAGTDYIVSAPRGDKPRRGRIALPANTVWPATLAQAGAVTVRFRCGYTADEIPALLKLAMLMDAETLFANRGNVAIGLSVAPMPLDADRIYLAYRSLPTQVWPGCN